MAALKVSYSAAMMVGLLADWKVGNWVDSMAGKKVAE